MKRGPQCEPDCSHGHLDGQRGAKLCSGAAFPRPKARQCRQFRVLRPCSEWPILAAQRSPAPRMHMPDMQARLKPEFSLRYPRLSAGVWYEVAPIFPGVTVRRVDIFGRRITRLKTARDF